MSVLLIAAIAAAAFYVWNRLGQPGRRPKPGTPGASALARAQELRTPLVRLATALNIPTQAAKLADRYEAGANGERYVAGHLAPLQKEGWTLLPDRGFPYGDANVDMLAISPRGTVYVLDAKKWAARHQLRVKDGRLWHGKRDVTDWLGGLHYATRTVGRLLSAQPVPVVVMVGPLKRGVQLRVEGIRIIPAEDVCDALRTLDLQQLRRQRGPYFIDFAARVLPPYTER
ncbi:nuclease-related domain-containing protein [Streptomyces mirabilis]|uniref:nuclease-related domain-containing protein n=1 Tax=Streptomyces mirabilis TaxID=68239 RepID=UPI003319A509